MILFAPSQIDIRRVRELDVRCFYEPWSEDIWSFCIQNYFTRVATHNTGLVGVVVAGQDADNPSQMRLMKAAVAPQFRRQGRSIELLRRVAEYAHERDCSAIDCWIAESYIYPTDSPWCVLGWFQKCGFKNVEIQRDMFRMQGYPEDGIRWEVKI